MRWLLPFFALLTLALQSKAETSRLDELLASGDYRALAEVIDKRLGKDEEVVSWLKSHSNEWHPSLFYPLAAGLLAKAADDFQKNSVTRTSLLAIGEMAQFYARGRTSFQIEMSDCESTASPTIAYWRRRNSELMLAPEAMMARSRESTVLAAELSVTWAKEVLSGSTAARGAATWLCGENNVLAEPKLSEARASALTEVEAQVAQLRRNLPPNPAVQGTLRDKAAQRP